MRSSSPKRIGVGSTQYQWETQHGYQAGDYRVTFYRELANGAITDVGGCTVLVALATGDIAGYVCHEGALGQGAESSPTLSAQDAIDAAVDEYEDLDGKTPTENVLVATADGQLVYQLRFEDQTETEIEAGLPVTVAVDANSGDDRFRRPLGGEPAPKYQGSSDAKPAKIGPDIPQRPDRYGSVLIWAVANRCAPGARLGASNLYVRHRPRRLSSEAVTARDAVSGQVASAVSCSSSAVLGIRAGQARTAWIVTRHNRPKVERLTRTK